MAARRAAKSATKAVKSEKTAIKRTGKASTKKTTVKKEASAAASSLKSESKRSLLGKLPNFKLNPGASQRIMLMLAIGLLILALGYFGRGILIAATVNGIPITRLELIRQLEQENGKATVENLITKRLVTQEAKNKGVKVTTQDVDKEIENIRVSIEEQGSTIEDALAVEGKTMQNLREAIEMDLTIEKIFAQGVEVGEDEAKAYYDANKEVYFVGQEYDQVKDLLIDNLAKQEIYTNYNTWLTQAKADARINYFVDF